jgi:hypothetical protein
MAEEREGGRGNSGKARLGAPLASTCLERRVHHFHLLSLSLAAGMNTHGGFFYTPAADDGASTAASASGFGSSSRPPPTAPRRLTPLQSSRLMAWLDAALLALSRNHRRRHAPDSPLRSLRAYCAAVLPVLAVLASVPPAPPAGSIKVGYLLQLSDVVPEACTGYDAHGGRPTGRAGEDVQQEEHDQEQLQEEELEDVGTTLARALQLMHLIDAQWHALVRGFELDYAAVQAEAAKLFPFIGPPATSAMPPSFDGRHAAAKPREVRQSDGASGRALSQTDRVRLQNIALRARTTLRAWGRAALDVEPLPEEDTFEKEERTRAEGDLEQKPEELDGIVELDDESEQSGDEVVVKQEGEEEEEEMEEVLVPPSTAHSASPPPRPREEQGKDDTEEGRHFANVFSKTVSVISFTASLASLTLFDAVRSRRV